jgi:hypothetical protein
MKTLQSSIQPHNEIINDGPANETNTRMESIQFV